MPKLTLLYHFSYPQLTTVILRSASHTDTQLFIIYSVPSLYETHTNMLIQFLYSVPLPENSYTYPNKPYIMPLIDL